MTSARDYRQEAKSTRQAARERLKELREARLRARTQSARTIHVTRAADNGSQIKPGDFFSMAAEASDVTDTQDTGPVGVPPNQQGDPQERNAGDIDQSDSARVAGPSDSELRTGAETEQEQEQGPQSEEVFEPKDEAESSPEPALEDAPHHMVEPAPDPVSEATDSDIARVDPNSDLFRLPGAGAGMVWMFHQCGIRTLEELAKANAGELASQLGVVGHIINMEPWIAYARECGQNAP